MMMMMEGMEPPDHFVETVVEEIGVDSGQHYGEEIVTSDSTIVTSGMHMHHNTVVYTDDAEPGMIMEGDEIGAHDIVGEVVTDDSHLKSHHHQIMHSILPGSHDMIVSSMIDEHSMISHHHMDHHHPGFVAMKPQGIGEVIVSSNHVILQDNVADEMIVEESVEVGDDDQSHGDIILVPNSMIKREDIIEGGEVVVGSSVGNEIVIDHIGTHVGNGRFFVGGSVDIGGDHIIDPGFDDSRLVIDTSGHMKMDDIPAMGYDCGECGAVLKSRASLKKHLRNNHAIMPRERTKPKKSSSANREEMAGPSPNKLWCCTSCAYSTQRRDKLDKHMQKHVLLEGYHPCGKKRHKPAMPPQRHRHNAEEYRCMMCTYSCTVYKAFKKHQKLHTSSGKHFLVKLSCKICGKDRSTEAEVQKHMKKHRDGRNFLCDVCGFASVQLKKIIQHRRMHTGEKPHLCPHCNYRSARRDNLRSHVRRMHKRENVYIDTFNPTEEAAAAAALAALE